MTGLIELGVITVLGIANTPFQRVPLVTIPSLRWELRPSELFFVGGTISNRCHPVRFNTWNPQTGLWDIKAGIQIKNLRISIGHVSEHGIDKVVKSTESRDYLETSFRVEF